MNYALFRKPSRYIGSEVNILRKDGDVRVALCFPDTYEIGMSHLGLKVLYTIINSLPGASAERVYAPWVDLEAHLREHKLPLSSLEDQRPLSDFDIIGFTLQYELSYTNVLNMLDLGGIPIRSEERENHYPLVIAGGPCTVNPLPLAPFIDVFVIGDGEEVIAEIIDLYNNVKSQKSEVRSKKDLLTSLSGIEGVYVPCIHDKASKRIKRRIVEDLDSAVFPDAPILPYTSVVHDRVAIEISRGCPKGCRFCQAGMIYRPLRERSLERVLSLAGNSIANTGYEEISFTSLSTGDYSSLLPLITAFNRMCRDTHTSVSLPSLRVGSVNSDVLEEIKSVRKTGFTIAPEAGTRRLRNVINKDVAAEEYTETLEKLFKAGWTTIKLYFMIGLPTETMEDIDGLIDMAVQASRLGRQIAGKRVNINVGISAFVPKTHTPFQWEGQNALDDLRAKQDYIRRAFRKRGINFKGQHVENSLLEAVFARGDSTSSLLLENAWKLGCRFDGWSEHFNFDKWEGAAESSGITLREYASRSFDIDEELPWEFIDTGISRKFLQEEHRKALNGQISADCLTQCSQCGIACQDGEMRRQRADSPASEGSSAVPLSTAGKAVLHVSPGPKVPCRMRITFSKTGILRYLSHQELMNAILRALKRADIPLSYSTGFHPHPKISFGPALPSGTEGLKEYFEVDIPSFVRASDFMKRLNETLPGGIRVVDAAPLPLNGKSLNDRISRYEYECVVDRSAAPHIHAFMDRQRCPVQRENKTVDIRPLVEKAEFDGDRLYLILNDTERVKVRIYELLREMLQQPEEEILSIRVTRTGLFGYNKLSKVCI